MDNSLSAESKMAGSKSIFLCSSSKAIAAFNCAMSIHSCLGFAMPWFCIQLTSRMTQSSSKKSTYHAVKSLFSRCFPVIVTSLRLPKWLFNPPVVLNNLPWSISSPASSAKSSSTQRLSCDSTLYSSISYFISPDASDEHQNECHTKVIVGNDVCFIR